MMRMRCFCVSITLLSLSLLGLQLLNTDSHKSPETPPSPCQALRIAILDVGTLPGFAGREKCDLQEDVHVDPTNGVVYPAGYPYPYKPRLGSPVLSVNAGPWFLMEAIRNGQLYTDNVTEADIVYVNDFCYYIKWLAHVHQHLAEPKTTPIPDAHGENLNAAYEALLQHPRWLKRGGTDFVFYESHSGFAMGSATMKVREKLCDSFALSVMIIHNRPMRNICDRFWQMRHLIIAPYVPNFIVQHALDQSLLPTMMPLASRTQLVYFRGRCIASESGFAGMDFRLFVVQQFALLADDSVSTACTDFKAGSDKGEHVPFAAVVKEMQRTKFCLALPGDAASSRRLSEMLGAGCIPVFLGPPYHSTPIAYAVDWISIAVFIKIQDYHGWMPQDFQWSFSVSERALHGQDARWWITDAPVRSVLVNLKTVDEVIPYLKSIPDAVIEEKLSAIAAQRFHFSFATNFTEPPNAVDTLVQGICMSQRDQLEQVMVM